MKYLMIGLVKLYQKIISPLKPSCCRFTPTCSAYAIEAFRKRGFFVGLILTICRIIRCNPFSKGGYDPVPERGLRNPTRRIEERKAESCCIAKNGDACDRDTPLKKTKEKETPDD